MATEAKHESQAEPVTESNPMPCDQIRTITLDLGKSDGDTMHAALKELGLNPTRQGDLIYFGRGEYINTKTGQTQLAPSRNANEIRQAYSKQVVTATAKKYGWQVRQTQNNQYEIVKR